MGWLYVTDSENHWAVSPDTPKFRAFFDEIKDLFEDEVPPITINEIDDVIEEVATHTKLPQSGSKGDTDEG